MNFIKMPEGHYLSETGMTLFYAKDFNNIEITSAMGAKHFIRGEDIGITDENKMKTLLSDIMEFFSKPGPVPALDIRNILRMAEKIKKVDDKKK